MAKLSRKKGTVSQIFHVSIKDSDSVTGAGKTGLVYNTAGLVCRYINSGGTLSASITLEDISTLGTYAAPTSNGHMRFKEVSAADPTKGLYELQVHNDWMNLSGGNVIIMLAGASGMADCALEIDLQADANLTTIQGDAQSTTDFKDFVDAGYDPATNKVQGVVLVDTTTTNTDMRGTDNGALASVCTEARLAELDAANIPTDLATIAAYVDELETRLSAVRAGYLDNLSAGAAALETTAQSILDDTAVIGAAGAGLTAVPWNAAWDAEVQSECTDALNAYDPPTNTEMVAAFTEIKGATWSSSTDTLEAIRDRGDSAWITATGFATSAALATAQTDLDTITGADGVTLATAQGNYAPLRGGVAMTESYAADGSTATPEQMFYMIWASLSEFAISGTTITAKKLNGSTTAMTFTLDSATDPTSRTRST